ncbi:MAG TPA: hypothetical protein VKY86_05480, partial [Promicromonospora sp.]|nr:hypothetical protein [Promicromonospora sp.]
MLQPSLAHGPEPSSWLHLQPKSVTVIACRYNEPELLMTDAQPADERVLPSDLAMDAVTLRVG